MDLLYNTLHSVPFFTHCTTDETHYLLKKARFSHLKKGQEYNLKKGNQLNVVLNGFFEIEALGRKDLVYLSPGSFFGTVPFSENRHQGTVKALVDSTLIVLDESEIYRFFLVHFKALRGYIKAIKKLGYSLSPPGIKITEAGTRIIAVHGCERNSGVTFFSTLLGLNIAEKGKTIICDLSNNGKSVFSYLNQEIKPPIAQKKLDDVNFEDMLNDRVVNVTEGLDLLNIAHSSNVSVDPNILSPIFFLLARIYNTIIIDIGDTEDELKNYAFGLADKVCILYRKIDQQKKIYEYLDSTLKDGQHVYYIHNAFYSSFKESASTSVLNLEKLSGYNPQDSHSSLQHLAGADSLTIIAEVLLRPTRAFIFESRLLNAIFFGGFFQALKFTNIERNIFYSSAYSYIVAALFLLNEETSDFSSRVEHFFSEEGLHQLLDITFPETYMFKNNALLKRAWDYAGDARCELLSTLPIALLTSETGEYRLQSTGYLKDVIASSGCIEPFYQRVEAGKERNASGFPQYQVKAQHLFRTDVDELVQVSVRNRENLQIKGNKIIPFFKNTLSQYNEIVSTGSANDCVDKNIVIEVAESDLKPGKLLSLSESLSENLLKSLRL